MPETEDAIHADLLREVESTGKSSQSILSLSMSVGSPTVSLGCHDHHQQHIFVLLLLASLFRPVLYHSLMSLTEEDTPSFDLRILNAPSI